jgi:hypothetical protein
MCFKKLGLTLTRWVGLDAQSPTTIKIGLSPSCIRCLQTQNPSEPRGFPASSQWLSVSDASGPFPAPRKHPNGMPDTPILSLADLRDAGGGQALGILHPFGMHWFAGTGPVVSLTLNHRLDVMMPPASDGSRL